MLYRYRLLGFDSEWQLTQRPRVEYEDLPLGRYEFEVVAVDRDLGYSAHPARVHIHVHWPYTWIVLCGLLLLALAISGWQARGIWLRNRRLRQSHTGLATSNVALHTALEEQEVLLKEVHHRVKNNMQVISILLNLRANQTDNALVQDVVRESQERIRTMVLVHEQLYQSPTLSEIDVGGYVGQLLANLRAYESGAGNVQTELRVEGAQRVGLETATSLGLQLVDALARQLQARVSVHREPDGGTRVELRFE